MKPNRLFDSQDPYIGYAFCSHFPSGLPNHTIVLSQWGCKKSLEPLQWSAQLSPCHLKPTENAILAFPVDVAAIDPS